MINRLKRRIILWAITGNAPREKWREPEILSAMAVSESDPVLNAVLALLQDRIDQAVNQVSRPDLALQPEAVIHVAGGLEWLREFGEYVEQTRQLANTRLANGEEDGG